MSHLDTYIALDTETTGFGPSARIIEIALVVFEKGQVIDSYETFLNPEGVAWESDSVKQAMEVNKIPIASLADAPKFKDVFKDLSFYLRESDVWAAHNIEFDLRMLHQEQVRLMLDEPLLEPKLAVCTKLMSFCLHPTEAGHKLAEVAPRWGVVQEGAHRAASDAITCGRILHSMVERGSLPADILAHGEMQKEAGSAWNKRGRRR